MPDTLNKQAIVNLLIDSPLREPIKINLIDIVNNTNEPDLPKVYSTITKELEIFQKATERRMKLAEETIAKLGGVTPTTPTNQAGPAQQDNSLATPVIPTAVEESPAPAPITAPPSTINDLPPASPQGGPTPPLSVPPLDLPPMPASPSASLGGPTPTNSSEAQTPPLASGVGTPSLQPLGGPASSPSTDEDALAEIQKELDSLKTATATEVSTAATPAPAPQV